MAETTARTRRRGLLLAAHTLLLALLLGELAHDQAWMGQLLRQAAEALASPLGLPEPGLWLAAAVVAVPAGLLAALTLWISPRTGMAFGLWTIAAIAVLTFPYAQLPWTRLLGGPAGELRRPSGTLWLVTGLLVGLATIETSVCARERVVDELQRRQLVSRSDDRGPASLVWTHRFGLAAALVAAGLVVGLFAALHPHLALLAGNLDLLWVPAGAGLVVGIALWLWTR